MKCVAKAIFQNRYMITVPNSACMTVGELKTFGMMDMGSEEENRAYLNEPRTVWANIILIAHHLSNGVPVTLMNVKDGAEMYELIITHLDNWIFAATNIPNCKLPPIDDMVLLDELAENLCQFNNLNDTDEPQSLTMFSLYSDVPKFYKAGETSYTSRLDRLFDLQGRKRRRGRK